MACVVVVFCFFFPDYNLSGYSLVTFFCYMLLYSMKLRPTADLFKKKVFQLLRQILAQADDLIPQGSPIKMLSKVRYSQFRSLFN